MNLFEDFKQLDAVTDEENEFGVDQTSLMKLAEITDSDDNYIDVVDTEAQTYSDLQDTYVGKVVVDCPVCKTFFFKNNDELTFDEEDPTLVNVGEECAVCGSNDGFNIEGKVVEFDAEEEHTPDDVETEETEEVEEIELDAEDAVDTDTEEASDNTKNESLRSVRESINRLEIETDDTVMTMDSSKDGKVEVITEPVDDKEEEHIDEVDIDIDDIDRKEFDTQMSEQLRSMHEGFQQYRTTKCTVGKNAIRVEGFEVINESARPVKVLLRPVSLLEGNKVTMKALQNIDGTTSRMVVECLVKDKKLH